MLNLTFRSFLTSKETLFRLLLVFSLTLWIVKQVGLERILSRTRFYWPFLAFLGVSLLSLISASSLPMAYREILAFGSYFLFFFLLVNVFPSFKDCRGLILAAFLAALISSLYLILQFYGLSFTPQDTHTMYSTFGQKNFLASFDGAILPLLFSTALVLSFPNPINRGGPLVNRALSMVEVGRGSAKASRWLERLGSINR